MSDYGATVDKVINVQELNDDILKVGTGYNPVPTEIIYPYIDKRTIITKKINDTIVDYHRYHKFKWDMLTQAFAFGPDFKKNYEHSQPVEAVDFYQLLCFLMQIPTEEHDGDWSRIEPMLTISAATYQTASLMMIMLWSIVSCIVM